MSLEYNPQTSEISYEGKVIGKYECQADPPYVYLEIKYECKPEDGEWVEPISWFASGLSLLKKHKQQRQIVDLSLETEEDDIEEEYKVRRFLTEKIVKRKNYIWQFHKNDPDHWPSELHAHDYDKGLKLDALTGNIFDVATKQKCKKLKLKILKSIQQELRSSADFNGKVVRLLG